MTLYAVHIEGPDDVIAAVDKDEADQRAAEINKLAEAFAARADASPHDPRFCAKVVEWPYDAEGHAEELTREDRWEL